MTSLPMNRIAFSLAFLVGGCGSLGPETTEDAVVLEVRFQPEAGGSGLAIGMDGHVGIVSVSTEATYAVVFACRHGKFVVSGADERAGRLWRALIVNDRVRVRYRERMNRRGDVVGYDFIDAGLIR